MTTTLELHVRKIQWFCQQGEGFCMHVFSSIALSENNVNLDMSFEVNKVNCNYYLPNDLNEETKEINNKNNFALLHLNIRSITNKFEMLKDLVTSLNKSFQIIALTETWLNDINKENFN
jgi:hypothetical protein